MSDDRNTWVMTTYVHQVIGEARTELLDELANQDMVDLAVVAAGGPTGIEGLRLHVNAAIAVMSDRSTDIKRIIASDDEVVAWWTVTGVHAAPFLGVETTGRRFTVTAFSFFRMRDGRIAEYEFWVDALGSLQQLTGTAAPAVPG